MDNLIELFYKALKELCYNNKTRQLNLYLQDIQDSKQL